jgi:SAM-dependent methyltransferase
MAPDVALRALSGLTPASLVLDPMAGSGTVVRAAAEQGHSAIGIDSDPLAVLMGRVWVTPIDTAVLRDAAKEIRTRSIPESHIALSWIDGDAETKDFVDYWFAEPQQKTLRYLTNRVLESGFDSSIRDALQLAISKMIVTKDHGASLARDVSHSRPHRAWLSNDFDVLAEFPRCVERLAKRLEQEPPPGHATVVTGDARSLTGIEEQTVDAVVTSPPYLNAIDYIRGHRLALVWFGHKVGDLRKIRSESIGTERGNQKPSEYAWMASLPELICEKEIPNQITGMLHRFLDDLAGVLREIARVLKGSGQLIMVVGNSCVKGAFIRNDRAVAEIAERFGLQLLTNDERELPPSRRYLPPPSETSSLLEKRMRTECVMKFIRA